MTNKENRIERPQYPVGTVLWNMEGWPRHGKVYWAPVCRCIQVSAEKGFLFDQSMPDVAYGNTWGNIGKNYFLTREECLAKWGDKPFIVDDERTPAEQEHPDPKEYGKRVVWRDDSTTIVTITTGPGRGSFPLDNLIWRKDDDAQEMMGCGGFLTLDEIRGQVWKWIGHKTIIEVREESPLNGVIHQVGNHSDDLWCEHGKTRGYA